MQNIPKIVSGRQTGADRAATHNSTVAAVVTQQLRYIFRRVLRSPVEAKPSPGQGFSHGQNRWFGGVLAAAREEKKRISHQDIIVLLDAHHIVIDDFFFILVCHQIGSGAGFPGGEVIRVTTASQVVGGNDVPIVDMANIRLGKETLHFGIVVHACSGLLVGAFHRTM
jgi:hypothetical protein